MQRNCTSQLLLPSLILVSLRRRRQRSLRILRSTATAVVGVRSDYAARKIHRAPTEVLGRRISVRCAGAEGLAPLARRANALQPEPMGFFWGFERRERELRRMLYSRAA